MPTRAKAEQDVTSLAVMVGEMRGQLREVVHTMNNVSSKIDGLSREVISLGPIAADIAEIKAEVRLNKTEIEALKKDRDERTGASNLISWVFRNWPGVVGFVLLIGILLRAEGKL